MCRVYHRCMLDKKCKVDYACDTPNRQVTLLCLILNRRYLLPGLERIIDVWG